MKNILLKWFQSLGFLVFTIEDSLIEDLKTDNFSLNKEEIDYNIKQYNNIQKHYSKECLKIFI